MGQALHISGGLVSQIGNAGVLGFNNTDVISGSTTLTICGAASLLTALSIATGTAVTSIDIGTGANTKTIQIGQGADTIRIGTTTGATAQIELCGDVHINGIQHVLGNTTFDEDITMGDARGDVVTLNGTMGVGLGAFTGTIPFVHGASGFSVENGATQASLTLTAANNSAGAGGNVVLAPGTGTTVSGNVVYGASGGTAATSYQLMCNNVGAGPTYAPGIRYDAAGKTWQIQTADAAWATIASGSVLPGGGSAWQFLGYDGTPTLGWRSDLTLPNTGARSISVQTSTSGAGRSLTVQAGTGATDSSGGDLTLNGGSGAGDADGGTVTINGGAASGTGSGGGVNIYGANGTSSTGDIQITGGNSSAGDGAAVWVTAGDGSSAGGSIHITAGASTAGSDGGGVNITGGASSSFGGDVTITGGASSGTTGGDVIINGGVGSASDYGSITLGATSTYGVYFGQDVALMIDFMGNANNRITSDIAFADNSGGSRYIQFPDDGKTGNPATDLEISSQSAPADGGASARGGRLNLIGGDGASNSAANGAPGGYAAFSGGSGGNTTSSGATGGAGGDIYFYAGNGGTYDTTGTGGAGGSILLVPGINGGDGGQGTTGGSVLLGNADVGDAYLLFRDNTFPNPTQSGPGFRLYTSGASDGMQFHNGSGSWQYFVGASTPGAIGVPVSTDQYTHLEGDGSGGWVEASSVTLPNGASRTISMQANTVGGGNDLTISSGNTSAAASAGGILTLNGGSSTTSGAGGAVNINGGTPTSGNGGSVNILGATAGTQGNGGSVDIEAGKGAGTGNGGTLYLYGGDAYSTGVAGNVEIMAGTSLNGTPGNVLISAGDNNTTDGKVVLGYTHTSAVEFGATGGSGTSTTINFLGHTGTRVVSDMVFSGAAARSIYLSAGAGAGPNFTLVGAPAGANGTAGGLISMTGGAGLTTGAGGAANITGGASPTGTGGSVNINAGQGNAGVSNGSVLIGASNTARVQFGDGTNGLEIVITGGSAELQAISGGTGMIDLPQNFKINNVSTVYATPGSGQVTAANLNTLTAGSSSNADALHTHDQTGATITVTTDGGTLNSVVYITGADALADARANALATTRAIGVKTASSKAKVVGTVTSVPYEGALPPTVGQPVYLSPSTAGYVQGTAPSAVGQFIVQIGICKSFGGGVCSIYLQVQPPIAL